MYIFFGIVGLELFYFYFIILYTGVQNYDEVEKLAYQLNEEAEWAERPIRRLSKVMYGSTCADMKVDVMGECLSSIKNVVGVRSVFLAKEIARRIAVKITPSCCLSEKWRIINLLDDIWMLLPRGRIIGKLEEGRSVTSVAAEFELLLTASFHDFGDNFKLQEQLSGGFSSGRPRGTTPADDRYIVLQARRNRWQTVGEIARHTTQATERPISRFNVARRLHGGGLFARRPVRCTFNACHRRRRSLWCREHRN
ncbi:transposable element Tcb2 transposase [Trichonephila clavipes]|nr:transposable element Tcb2 transposase [Trichonephila clavipes]